MSLKCNLFIISLIIGLSSTAASSSANEIPETKGNAKLKCESSYSLMCLKLDILSLIDKISTTNKEYNIASGITLVRENNPNKTQNSKIVSELARAFPDSPEKRLNGFLIAKIQDFLQSYTVKLQLLSDDSVGAFESRKKGGGGLGGDKKGGMGGIVAMAMMMKGTMMAMGLAAVAALAGKALLASILALTLAAIAGLKSLTSGGEKKTTYEIISKPVYSHSHSHTTGHSAGHAAASHEEAGHGGYGGGYGRSFINAFPLPESVKA